MIELQVYVRNRWTDQLVDIDALSTLIDEVAAVAWDRDIANAPGIPFDDFPRLYDETAAAIAQYPHPCLVFGRPMGYWRAVAVWLADDKRWDIRRRRGRDSPESRDYNREQRYDLADYLNDDTWIRIATGDE